MRRLRINLFLFMLVVTFTFVLKPTTAHAKEDVKKGKIYYVSDSEGDDTNDGLSKKKPIKSIEKVSELELKAGDQLLFKSGDIFYGTLRLNLSQGAKDNPIIISSYGEGERPSLRYYTGDVMEGATEHVMIIQDANGVEFKNLDIGYANAGIRFDYTTLGNEYVRFEECHFHDIYGTHQQHNLYPTLPFSASIYAMAAEGVEFTMGDVDDIFPLHGMYINRCTTYDAGSLTGYVSVVHGLYMTECIAEQNAYYGAVVNATTGYVDRCVFSENGSRSMPVGSCGLMVTAQHYTIKNSIIRNQQRQGTDPDGCGIDFEWGAHNVTIDNVLFEGNAGVGIMFFTSGQKGGLGENKGTNYDCTIQNCKFVNNNTNPGNPSGFEIYCVEAATSGCVVKDCEYVIDYTTNCQTTAFECFVGENDLKIENVTLVDAIDENYNPLFEQNTDEVANEPFGNKLPIALWVALGVVEGLVIGVIVLLVMQAKKRKEVNCHD